MALCNNLFFSHFSFAALFYGYFRFLYFRIYSFSLSLSVERERTFLQKHFMCIVLADIKKFNKMESVCTDHRGKCVPKIFFEMPFNGYFSVQPEMKWRNDVVRCTRHGCRCCWVICAVGIGRIVLFTSPNFIGNQKSFCFRSLCSASA